MIVMTVIVKMPMMILPPPHHHNHTSTTTTTTCHRTERLGLGVGICEQTRPDACDRLVARPPSEESREAEEEGHVAQRLEDQRLHCHLNQPSQSEGGM